MNLVKHILDRVLWGLLGLVMLVLIGASIVAVSDTPPWAATIVTTLLGLLLLRWWFDDWAE